MEDESVLKRTLRTYDERRSGYDEHVRDDGNGTITWETSFSRYSLVLPSDGTRGVGLLQAHLYDPIDGTHDFSRYYFDAATLRSRVTCSLPDEAVRSLDPQAFEDMILAIEHAGDPVLTSDDVAAFHAALFSAPES